MIFEDLSLDTQKVEIWRLIYQKQFFRISTLVSDDNIGFINGTEVLKKKKLKRIQNVELVIETFGDRAASGISLFLTRKFSLKIG